MLTSTIAVLSFLLFTAPGFLFQLLADRRRPSVTESAFRDASRVLLSGLIFSTAAVGILSIARAIGLDAIPNLRLLVLQPTAYVASNFADLFIFLVLLLVISLTIAVLCHVVLRRLTLGLIVPRSAWDQVFKESVPKNSRVRVRVKMENGALVVGYISSYTAGVVVPDERELVLEQPIWVQAPKESRLAEIDAGWQRHIVPGKRIVSVTVAYLAEERPGAVASRWQRWLAVLQKWV